MKKLLLFVLLLTSCTTVAPVVRTAPREQVRVVELIERAPLTQPIPQEDAIQPGSWFPSRWVVCVDETWTYNNPGAKEEWRIGSLQRDQVVTVRELDSTRTWAMIQPAVYVEFRELCRP